MPFLNFYFTWQDLPPKATETETLFRPNWLIVYMECDDILLVNLEWLIFRKNYQWVDQELWLYEVQKDPSRLLSLMIEAIWCDFHRPYKRKFSLCCASHILNLLCFCCVDWQHICFFWWWFSQWNCCIPWPSWWSWFSTNS